MQVLDRITEKQARAAYEAICVALQETPNPGVYEQGVGRWPCGPVLVRGFEDRYPWAVVFEGGAWEWTFLVVHGGVGEFGERWTAADLPGGVRAEAINHYSVALYRT